VVEGPTGGRGFGNFSNHAHTQVMVLATHTLLNVTLLESEAHLDSASTLLQYTPSLPLGPHPSEQGLEVEEWPRGLNDVPCCGLRDIAEV
jgi:hypothetical protein